MKIYKKVIILLTIFIISALNINIFGYSKPSYNLNDLKVRPNIIALPRAMNEAEPDSMVIDNDRIIVNADKCYVYSINGKFLFRFTPRGGVKVSPDGYYYAYNWWDKIFMKFDSNGNLISKFGEELIKKLQGDITNGMGEETFGFLSDGSVVIGCSPSVQFRNHSKCVIVDKNWERIVKTFSINNEQNSEKERIRNFKIYDDKIYVATMGAKTISIYSRDGKFIEYLYGLEESENGEIQNVSVPSIKAFTKEGDIIFLKDGSLCLLDAESRQMKKLPIKGDYNHLLSVATKDNDIYIIDCSRENRYNRSIEKFAPPDYKTETVIEFYERGSKSMFELPIHCMPLEEGRFLIVDQGVKLIKIVNWNNITGKWILERNIPFPGTFTFSPERMGVMPNNEIIGIYRDFSDNKEKVIKVSLINGSSQDINIDSELPIFIKSFPSFPETSFLFFEEGNRAYRIKNMGRLSDFDLKIEIDRNQAIESFCVLPNNDVALAIRPMPVAGRNPDLRQRIIVYNGKDGGIKEEIIIPPYITGTMRISSTESGEMILVNNQTSHIIVIKSDLSELLVKEFPKVNLDENEPHSEFSEDFINSFQGIGFAVNVYTKDKEIYICDTFFKRIFVTTLSELNCKTKE